MSYQLAWCGPTIMRRVDGKVVKAPSGFVPGYDSVDQTIDDYTEAVTLVKTGCFKPVGWSITEPLGDEAIAENARQWFAAPTTETGPPTATTTSEATPRRARIVTTTTDEPGIGGATW